MAKVDKRNAIKLIYQALALHLSNTPYDELFKGAKLDPISIKNINQAKIDVEQRLWDKSENCTDIFT